ncbi:hypothetical protein FOZ63_025053, partial [Perkinsus olseni]
GVHPHLGAKLEGVADSSSGLIVREGPNRNRGIDGHHLIAATGGLCGDLRQPHTALVEVNRTTPTET